MASTVGIKRRIASVKGTRQITKAQELVSASKIHRAQAAAARTLDYAKAAKAILSHLNDNRDTTDAPLFKERPVKNRLYILVSSDRGLAGAYNYNVLKRFSQEVKKDFDTHLGIKVIAIGKKAGALASRVKGIDTLGVYADFPDEPDTAHLLPIIGTATDLFLSGEIDEVIVLYTNYHSSVVQTVDELRLIPAGVEEVEVDDSLKLASFEPSAEEVLEKVTMRLLEAQLMQAVLSAAVSEHTMRMIAMKNASDNARDIIDDLTLEMNKARQAVITQELAEISGGVEAMS
jgi:F-type H+-transporting ATPase subunit gamma